MIKVITYGTYDLLHYGHIRLLKRAKALGDFLIVGITSDDFDKNRGKINTKQTLIERVEAVRATGLADLIIIEEYEGQKIDDIKKYGVDIFTVGSDWVGKFDYLKEYCDVVYLDRTSGVSSTEIREMQAPIKVGYVGNSGVLCKYYNETRFVNGLQAQCVVTDDVKYLSEKFMRAVEYTNFENMCNTCDAAYVLAQPDKHYDLIKELLLKGKHVLVESPVCMNEREYFELKDLAKERQLVLMESIKTAYSTAYHRLLLLAKSGAIGKIVSVDATCTSLRRSISPNSFDSWNSISAWGPTALLPVFQLLGTEYISKNIINMGSADNDSNDYVRINFVYKDAIANITVSKSVKSEGTLVISGTKGCIYVPAPWWKTDYFEVHYENVEENKRYFYQLDGEGIRNELLAFYNSIERKRNYSNIESDTSKSIVKIIEDFNNRVDFVDLKSVK